MSTSRYRSINQYPQLEYVRLATPRRTGPNPLPCSSTRIQTDRIPGGQESHNPRIFEERYANNDSTDKVHRCSNQLGIQHHTRKSGPPRISSSHVIMAPVLEISNKCGNMHDKEITENHPRMLYKLNGGSTSSL